LAMGGGVWSMGGGVGAGFRVRVQGSERQGTREQGASESMNDEEVYE